jgi:hypothetical protein
MERDWLHVGHGHYFAPAENGAVAVGQETELPPNPGVRGRAYKIEAVRIIDRETWLRVLDHVGR